MLSTTSIPNIKDTGIALDIDETLSWTIWYWVEQMQKKFWNPEWLSVEEVVKKYRYTQNVPYRQTNKAKEWIKEKIQSNDLQKELPVIEWAKEYVTKIHEIIPIVAYITVRPEVVYEWTRFWLKKNSFPDAPIIMKPNTINKEEWNNRKGQVLKKLYPKVLGIIDDNPWLAKSIEDYGWKIILYDNENLDGDKKNVRFCRTRDSTYYEVKKLFWKNEK